MLVQPGTRCAVVLSVVLMARLPAQPQEEADAKLVPWHDLLRDFEPPEFVPYEFLVAYFPSELMHNSIAIKSYVRSERFREIRRHFGDAHAVDAMYLQALRLTHGNTALALLYCTTVSMDHRVVGIRVPVLSLSFPLSNESADEFADRVANLPRYFYSDSPPGTAGDRDKLQHFFGSALIVNLFESRGAAERVGRFVEWGEDAFIVDGAFDERDIRANRHGREFGLALLQAHGQEHGPMPSEFLRIRLAKAETSQVSDRLCGAW